MTQLFQVLEQHPLVYIARDIERALGVKQLPPGYHIITNATRFAKTQAALYPNNIHLIDEATILDTHELLQHNNTAPYIASHNIQQVLVFKQTAMIEAICQRMGLRLLNPAATLAKTVEEKISQVTWLAELATWLPPHTIDIAKNIAWNGEAFILQFNRAHTGSGTMLIRSAEELQKIQTIFPNRPVRVSAFINGYTITNNTIVTDTDIVIGNISQQITGLAPFTNEAFVTIGNDFALPQTTLNYTQRSLYTELANLIGKKLQQQGWRGAFGIDAMIDNSSGQLYLLEINARQPASVTFESWLQLSKRAKNSEALTTFEAHLCALLNIDITGKTLVPLCDGAQIILRHQGQTTSSIDRIEQAINHEYTVIRYDNTEPNSDVLRIQSEKGFLASPTTLTPQGNHLVETINTALHS